MDETLCFFNQLLTMTRTMVDDIVPDLLLHLDQPSLEHLMEASQEVLNSLQVFVKLCDLISRKNLSASAASLAQPVSKTLCGKMMKVVDPPAQPRSSDSKSVDSAKQDQLWRELLTEAVEWYLSHPELPRPAVFFCAICQVQAKAKHVWDAHLSGKKHIKNVEDCVSASLVCEICGFTVCSDYDHLNVIHCSDEHAAFDQACRKIKCSSAGSDQSESPMETRPEKPEEPTNDLPSRPSSSKSEPVQKNPASQNPPKKVVFQNIEIHTDFVQLTEEVASYLENHESFGIGYCRPCEVICRSKEIWINHKKTPRHSGKMSSKIHNNILCRCLQCEFVITAGERIAVMYMKYHIERCHCQSTVGIKEEEYMAIQRFLRKIEPSSNANSFKGSVETICSVPGSAPTSDTRDDVGSSSVDLRSSSAECSSDVFPERTKSCSSPAPSVQGDGNRKPKAKTPGKKSVNPYRSTNPSEVSDESLPDGDVPEGDIFTSFTRMLNKKEKSFKKDRSFKLFTALCSPCKTSDFSDRFQWIDHVMQHGDSGPEQEIECPQCNSCFFGELSDVNSFIEHDYHTLIDALLIDP